MTPLAGLQVVEVALGVSAVGAGLASLPGSLLRDLGADVVRVRSRRRPTLDAGVEFARGWDRGKEIVEVDDADPARAGSVIAALAETADVLFVTGREDLAERMGLRAWDLARSNPRLVVARIRPGRNALGVMADLELLVAARSGLLTQIRGHRPGPAFADLTVASAGAGLSAAVGALACLVEREATGLGGWAETSLYDGMQAILPMIIGRAEHHSPSTTLLWQGQGPAESLSYRCADGEYLQLWFGAKGAYDAFLAHLGDPPSEQGYQAELISGAMAERGERWAARFAARDRDWWIADLAGQNFRCEPVWRPGEALRDPHVVQAGLSVRHDDPELGPMTVLGPVIRVTAAGDGEPEPGHRDARLLEGVHVLDLSAFLAGPIAPLVLAELGADVVKVEPLTGDVHRTMEPMFAAGQRGKRAVALDLKAPDAPAVLERLFRWSDVVHHNSRVGVAERLGYDEARVRAVNPGVVYSFASGFGEHGPRAPLPANDQLMQALSGVEAAQAGHGQPPAFLVWGAVDVTGGWLAACGMLAGLYARRRHGGGQSVATSLLGAALTLKSGAFLTADRVVSGPVLDARQTGYGAAYRIYQGRDGAWFALAVPDEQAWHCLRAVVGLDRLPASPPPLRTDADPGPQPEEVLLEDAFLVRDAAAWVTELRAAGVPAEPVVEADRSGFAAGFLDDPVNHQLGRVVSYQWGERGRVDQPRFPPRFGPAPHPRARPGIPGLGEHTAEVLESLGERPPAPPRGGPMQASAPGGQITDEWVEQHFDHLSPELARELHPTLARARSRCPVAHSDAHGGFWVVTRYEDVLRIAQDWRTFSSELGITVPSAPVSMKILPVTIDPPLQRTFKQLLNAHFTPAKVAPWTEPTRQLVNHLIDGFIERGEVDFMTDFARPFPGLAFFDQALHAPAADLEEVSRYATMASLPHLPESRECLLKLAGWIGRLVEQRRHEGPRGDVVDAVMNAEIEGRPITREEVIGCLQLLVLGGLETTAGVLGAAMLRFCEHPEIPAQLRDRPELIGPAVEELLRLDGSFICIGRTARHDVQIDGHQVREGERVIIYWASANRDEAEFGEPDAFDLGRTTNRHVAFGAGPHRCVGSNLARMNLRIAVEEIVRRLHDLRLQPGAGVDFHSTFNRAPLSVPITFTPGPRRAGAAGQMITP